MKKTELERPILAVDAVMFRIQKKQLELLLHQRKKEPYKDALALPGAAVRMEETLTAAARRSLTEKTEPHFSDADIYMEQLAAFDALYRDPRGRTVSIAFMGLISGKSFSFSKGVWQPVMEIENGSLPFDHNQILDEAVRRLQGKLRYTNIAAAFLTEQFRIEALQDVYECILGRSLNRSNFRNKLLKIGMIEQVKVLSDAVGKKGGRPPHLYCFKKALLTAVDRDFL